MTRNWRGYAARVQFYFNEGSTSLAQIKQALYASAALKIIFEWSVLTAVLTTPVVFMAMFVWGVFWIRHGWYKQLTEVPTIDAVAPISMWTWHMQVRLCERMGIEITAKDLEAMPKELQTLLSSYKQVPR